MGYIIFIKTKNFIWKEFKITWKRIILGRITVQLHSEQSKSVVMVEGFDTVQVLKHPLSLENWFNQSHPQSNHVIIYFLQSLKLVLSFHGILGFFRKRQSARTGKSQQIILN